MNLLCLTLGHKWNVQRCDRTGCEAWRSIARDTKKASVNHHYNIWPEHARAAANGKLPFILCKQDDSYNPGDVMELVEWSPTERTNGPTQVTMLIVSIKQGCDGVEPGYMIVGLKLLSVTHIPRTDVLSHQG